MIYDIAILGAGPAGANAALSAQAAGCSVALLDEQPKAGGQVWRAKSDAILQAPSTPESEAGRALRSILETRQIAHFSQTRVWQIARREDVWELHIAIADRSEILKAKRLILATGAREYVQPLPGWTTPGVVGLAGATALMKQEQTPPGQNTVVSGTGPLVFFVASEIRRLGGSVSAVVTPNARRDWAKALPAMARRPDLLLRGARWMADLALSGVPIHWRAHVVSVDGDDRVTGVQIQSCDAEWVPRGGIKTLSADSLCLGHGLVPNIEAAQMLGVPLHHDPSLGGWVPELKETGASAVEGLFVCGDGSGIRGAAAAQLQGARTGIAAAKSIGKEAVTEPSAKAYQKAARFGAAMTQLSMPRPGLLALSTAETIICRCESLKTADIAGEISSGAGSTNAVKSGKRAGMGPCGGKFCQIAVARLIAQLNGCGEATVKPPTARPPLRPVPVSDIAGEFDYSSLPIPKPAPL